MSQTINFYSGDKTEGEVDEMHSDKNSQSLLRIDLFDKVVGIFQDFSKCGDSFIRFPECSSIILVLSPNNTFLKPASDLCLIRDRTAGRSRKSPREYFNYIIGWFSNVSGANFSQRALMHFNGLLMEHEYQSVDILRLLRYTKSNFRTYVLICDTQRWVFLSSFQQYCE